MSDRSLSRRGLLKTSAGGLAAGVASGLAGCSAIPGFGGGGKEGSARTENWAYANAEMDEFDQLGTNYLDFGAIREFEDDLPDEFVDRYESGYEDQYGDPLGLEWEAMDWVVSVVRSGVLAADHEAAAVVERLTEERDYEEDDDVDGYTVLTGPDGRFGYAVDGSRVLWAGPGVDDPAVLLETLIGTQTGDTDMAADEDEDFAAALDAVSGDNVSTLPGIESENVATRASSWTLGSDTTTSTVAWVFEDESDVNEGELRDGAYFDADEVSFEGRTVLWEWEFDTEEFGSGGE